MTRIELKNAAKEQIKGNIGTIFLMFFTVFAILIVCNFIPFIGGIATMIITPAFSIGIIMAFLALTRKEEIAVGDVFNGFPILGKALWLNIITSFFVFLWTLLLCIPGIIKSISYSMAPYILAENPTMKAREALNESKRIMNGHKMDFFVLGLSFIGWGLLMCITFGIAAIYVVPYMQATIANFYNSIKE